MPVTLAARVENMSLSVVLHESWKTLEPWSDRWDQWAENNPFRTWNWVTTWWSFYGPVYPRRRLQVLSIHSERELLGFAPLFKSWHPFWGWTIRFLGSGEVCGDDLGWIAPQEFQEHVGRVVAGALQGYLVKIPSQVIVPDDKQAGSVRRVACRYLDLDGIKASDRGILAFLDELKRLGWRTDARAIEHCWQIELPETWTDYLQNVLGRAMRKKVRRLEDRHLASGEVKVHTVCGSESWDQAWGYLVRLHQARRQQLGDGGAFDSSAFRQFHQAILNHLLPVNKVRLIWLEWHGQPIAAEYLLISGQIVRGYQSGMDPKFAHMSPGFLANLAAIQQAIAEGYSMFDFLRGDEPYKAEWGAQPVKMLRIRAVPPRPMARLRFAMWNIARTCRNKLRKENKGEHLGVAPTQQVVIKDGSTTCQETTEGLTCSVCD